MPSSGTPQACMNEVADVFGLDLPVADWAKEEGIADEEDPRAPGRRRPTRHGARKKAANFGPQIMR